MPYVRDDGSFVDVEYVIEQHGYPSNCWDDAGEPTIVNVTEVYDANGDWVELTDAERERIEREVGEMLDSETVYPDDQ